MATKIKKLYKKFKFISRIFAVKERRMEIGHPTDVKRVTHIGLDTPSDTASSWEDELKKGFSTDLTATSVHNSRSSNFTLSTTTWSSQDFEESMGCKSATEEEERPAFLGSSKCFSRRKKQSVYP
ncbi:CRIB domain-containing protein RIC10 [Hibiscus syriacus]|uniref:CRIB domain-containing protein RIC10 n=1 Tax=Hibiscus syriacus TaxID=106335 RepID=A0A6A2ZEQ0_HIBSY|nr:CRIB domain-containing protein RIC10 [Hibiscus syriacus]